MQRVMIFVDQANFYKAAKSRGRQADLLKLKDYLANPAKGRLLVEMVVYLGFPPLRKNPPGNWEDATDRMQRLRDKLNYEGIMTVVHYGKQDGEPDEQGNIRFTANVDILMAMDALEFALDVRPDVVVLVTGDQDFAYLAEKLRRKGIRVEAANIEGQTGLLKKSVNSFIDLDDLFRTMEGRPIGDDSIFDPTTE